MVTLTLVLILDLVKVNPSNQILGPNGANGPNGSVVRAVTNI